MQPSNITASDDDATDPGNGPNPSTPHASRRNVGHKQFVGNLAFPLNNDPGDEIDEMATQYTISQINLPPSHG